MIVGDVRGGRPGEDGGTRPAVDSGPERGTVLDVHEAVLYKLVIQDPFTLELSIFRLIYPTTNYP